MNNSKDSSQNFVIGDKSNSIIKGYVENNTHYFQHYVTFSESDAAGIIYHGRYFDIAERARGDMLMLVPYFDTNFEENKKIHQEIMDNYVFVIHSSSARYIRPIKVLSTIRIESNILEIKGLSMVVLQRFYLDDDLCTELTIKFALVSYKTLMPTRIPEFWVKHFKTLIKQEEK